jgi:hypothetical protein
LREALSVAVDNDVIVFDNALAGQTITLLSDLPSISANLKIIGPEPPAAAAIVSGNSSFTVFQVIAGNVEIQDLDVTDAATAGSGAGLFVNDFAKVTYARGSFSSCDAAGAEGGAVHIGADAFVSFEDTTFSLNTSGGFGDDVYLDTDATLIYDATGASGTIEVYGHGNLDKLGVGSVTFTIPSSTPLSLVVVGGTVTTTGVRTDFSAVSLGARLEGEETTTYIANHGTFKPSVNIGTSTTTGDYHQDTNGTLEIAITPSDQDLLAVGGNAYLIGALFIDPAPGLYTTGETRTILTTGGQVVNEFTSVTASAGTFQVNYFTDRVDIEVITPP